MPHCPALGAVVAKAHILEAKALADRAREGPWIERLDDLGLDLEEGEEVVQVERLGGDARDAHEEVLHEAAQPQEGAGEEGEVADAELAVNGGL